MIAIEIDTPANGNVLFNPIGERVRGRFDPARVGSEDIGKLCRELPRGVPGQRIEFDPATNTGRIVEPLADPANADIRAAVEKRLKAASPNATEIAFPPAVKEFPNADAATWTGWMRRCVAAGVARLVSGKLPAADPEGMKRSFFSPEPRPDPKDDTIAALTRLLLTKLSPAERKELSGILGK